MSRLNYIIDENDIESQRALNDLCKDAPDPAVVSDMQTTLARVLQSQTPPMAEGGNTAQAINQNSMWQ